MSPVRCIFAQAGVDTSMAKDIESTIRWISRMRVFYGCRPHNAHYLRLFGQSSLANSSLLIFPWALKHCSSRSLRR